MPVLSENRGIICLSNPLCTSVSGAESVKRFSFADNGKMLKRKENNIAINQRISTLFLFERHIEYEANSLFVNPVEGF